MIRVCNVTKIYNNGEQKIYANKDINIDIKKGELVGLFGANGSGKSTLVRQIVGITTSTSGNIYINDNEVSKNTKKVKKEIGYMSQSAYAALWGLTVKEAIYLSGRLQELSNSEIKSKFEFYKGYFSLNDSIDKAYFGSLSGGMRKIITFIIAVLKDNPILILDEPSNELDPHNRRLLWQKILDLNNRGTTIILVTHNITEVENIINKIIILSHGEVVQDTIPQKLGEAYNDKLKLQINFHEAMTKPVFFEKSPSQLKDLPLIDENENQLIYYVNKKDLNKLTEFLNELNCILNYNISKITLEEICYKFFAK